MAMDDVDTTETRTTGLLASLQRLLGSFAEILHTRVEILSTEVEEAGWIVRQLLFYVLVSVFFLGLGLLTATLFVVKASPETYQLYVLGGFALLYLGIGAITALVLRHKLQTRPRLFSTTLAELDKDRNHLVTRS
jgi:uncharacterized membrane protein YqjE